MSKKASELEGLELDYWVAKANEDLPSWFTHEQIAVIANVKKYSSNWSQGGPIIEGERISSFYVDENDPYPIDDGPWSCAYPNADVGYTGKTNLIAAMRCFVVKKFGEEVPDE